MASSPPPLSEREIELLQLVATGATNRQIAYRLNISVNTVKVHIRNIFAKIGAESRTEATMIAVREGWISVPGVTGAPTEQAAAVEQASSVPESALQPLPWPKRVFLLTVLLLAIGVIMVTWPRGNWTPGRGHVDLPPERASSAVSALGSGGSESRWRMRAQMPTPRAYAGTAAVDGRIFVVGGRTVEGVTGAVEIYDPGQDLWSRGMDKPEPAAYLAVGAIGDELYVPGGCDAAFQPLSSLEVYDVSADAWQIGTPLPQPRCASAVAVLDGRLYLFGGWDGERYTGDVYIYDPQTAVWVTGRAMRPRGFAAAAVANGQIIVVGGYDGRRELTTCEAYIPSADAWQECEPLMVGRGGLGLALVGERLYAIGGGGWSSYLGFSEGYSLAQHSWDALETPIVGEWRGLGVVALETSLYAIGGWSGGYLGLTYEYQVFPFRIFIPASRQD